MDTISNKTNPSEIFFGKTRRLILALLLSQPNESFYLREIVRLTGSGLGGVQRELRQLTEAGIILRTRRGNQVYFQANQNSPIFKGLKNILEETTQAPSQSKAAQVSPETIAQRFNIPPGWLAEFCRRNHIRKLSLYGSVLRDDFRPDSDIDLLVEFEEGHTPGFAIISIEDELSHLVGRKVDLRTAKDLSRYFRDEVVRDAKTLYE